MRSILYFLAFFIFALSACNSSKPKNIDGNKKSLIGKWYRFSMANGYSEFDIDSQYVVFYNQKVGRFKLAYKMDNDSLRYLTKPYVAMITNYGDSVLMRGNDSTEAVLHRFKAPNIPFETIPEQKDSLKFASYIADFDKRLIREFEKAGIKISDGMEKPEGPAYEELLKNRLNK
ncbi:hypothetical protein EV200_103440 [Pedobacter psychrotolerans]|uniref:Apolipoprotein D and lipocalin family protein n=2 Tax=Pedobacter psychrotolerans TaxID=1843235 RepID=A0A4R2HHG2_9SPHI|nr:hypothetical protein [Pedobacter psychrotolerans]TCO27106.1 hypothetical protein EV200_103440 [Pedobacter psychrotolerans]